ncbi:putative isoprenylcysteine alpha-carbonyl methylesterase ICMEL2 [Forsythia ovata]|uniref:Isoprenylcysteine alpha-carbonyl methylesterase ICMEL2 n=1 Tax=Forsythia ovata TaxID=205694 RepID=A0ABD1T3V1_9LAMI
MERTCCLPENYVRTTSPSPAPPHSPLQTPRDIYKALNMQPQILPISNPIAEPLSLSSSMVQTATAADTMLLRSEDDLPTTRLLISSSFEDDAKMDTRSLISRTLSCTNISPVTSANSNSYQQRRRRIASDTCLSTLPDGRRHSFRQEMGKAASNTYLITRLSFKLLRYLR